MLVIAGNWWTFVLRGLLAILFGLLTFFRPGIALITLVYMFGFYAMADGLFNIAAAFRRGGGDAAAAAAADHQPWWVLAIQGVMGLIAGLLALVLPGLTALALAYLIAAWAIVTGIAAIVAAARLRRHVRGEWVLVLSGALSVLFGLLMVIRPVVGTLALVLWIGAYATVFGIMLIALGVRLRTLAHRLHDRVGDQGIPPTVAPGH